MAALSTAAAHFHYEPNQAAAIAALVAFIAAAIVTTVVNIRVRTCWFMFVVTLTALCEMGGYAARLAMLSTPTMGTYIAMQTLLIIPPIFLAVVDYITVGKLLALAAADRVGCLGHKQVAWLFTASDVVTLLIQGGGAGFIVSTNPQTANMGKNILLAGLLIQLVFFALFTAVTLRLSTGKKYGLWQRPGARQMFLGLYVTIAILAIRNIFRCAEFAQGYNGYLATTEGLLYAFDTILIFLCIVIMTWFHPGFLLPKIAASQQQQCIAGDMSHVVVVDMRAATVVPMKR